MNHSQVAHRWANDSYGRNGQLTGPRMFATQGNRAIYSHGYHFCIARKTGIPEFPVLYTYRDYSVSTSKHKGEVRNALTMASWQARFECHNPADSPATILHTEWTALRMDSLPALTSAVAKLAAMESRIAARAAKGQPESATLASQLETLQGDVATRQTFIRDRALQLDRFARAFGVNLKRDCPSTYPIARSFLKSDDFMTLSATLDKQAAKAAKDRAKQAAKDAAKARAEAIDYLNDWVTDTTMRTPHYSSLGLPTRLRVKDGQVETSRGASVPVKHAVRLFKLATHHKDAARPWTSPPEKSFSVGHYKLEKIDERGNVVIGCHELSYDEMSRVAPQARAEYAAQPVTAD